MPWYFPWSDSIKKRSCRYLLQRYLGQFLEEKLTLDQLTVDLYNGTGSVSNVTLDVQALNELGEQHNWPFEFVDGFISEISVSIPWSSLLNESSYVEVYGLNLVIQPKPRSDCCASSMFESMWSSMTSSIQLAEECLKQTPEAEQEAANIVGVEEFAKTIDSILTRVKLKFLNTVIRLEHLPKDSVTGAAIEIHLKQFSYFDETNTEMATESPTKPSSVYSVKMFSFDGVELYSNEFYASNRTICRSLLESTSSLGGENDIIERKNNASEIILFAKFLERHEIRMKIKQKEQVSGPKIDLEMNMSSLAVFLSPRQLRTICEVVCGLMSPHSQDTSNVVNKSRYHQKPMTPLDFERVEQELNQHISPSNITPFVSKSLQNATGWSSGGVEDESDDDFHPVKGHRHGSASSSTANSVSSSFSSSTGSYQYNSKMYDPYGSSQFRHHHSKHKEKGGGSGESDFNGDISSFQLRLNFLTIILLHQDILVSPDGSTLPSATVLEEMKNVSKQFFSHFISLTTSCVGRNDFKNGRKILQKAISGRNHFRLYCTTNILNAEEKSNSTSFEVQGSITMANVELVECLVEVKDNKSETVELLVFSRHDFCATNEASVFSKPDVIMNFKHFDNSKHFTTPSKTELTVNLQDCRSEFDVTIIDRLVHIINNFTILWNSFLKPVSPSKTVFSDVVSAPTAESKFEWKVSTPFLMIKLRFPIPDLRTDVEDPYSFWEKRDVYNDLLFVEFTDCSVQSLGNDKVARSYEVLCKSVRILFQESNCDKPIPFILSEVDEKYGMSLPNGGKGFGWPRLVIRLCPVVGYIELEEEIELKQEISMNQSIMQTQKQEPSPFTAKMIMRESDTSHSRSTSSADGEEIILPGNKEEMGEFVEDASHNALVQLDATLPALIVQLPSKHFYEVVYNRFNTDLMLWTPKTSKKSFSGSRNSSFGQNLNLNFNPASTSLYTSFSVCKSTAKNNSDSEDEEDEFKEDVFAHHSESVPRSFHQKNAAAAAAAANPQQSKVTFSVFAAHGVLDAFPHARDSTGKVIPGQFGEAQIIFNEANLFFVSGYKGQALLNYVCLQVNHISLYHCNLLPGSAELGLKPIDSYPNKYLLPTIYKTDTGALIAENGAPVGVGSTVSEDMLTLAVRAQGQENRLKNICVANSLHGATIRHRMNPPFKSWLSQLIDFFDILDYPTPNYQPWKVVTQFHQQFLNCVIDYRPLHLPLKAALTVENFNISSNITAKTSTSILRFIAEEASLFISNKVSEKRGDQSENLSIDLRNDYVCVVELGLFELSLRFTDSGEGEPQTDLRASSNIVHIRTCADSTIALMELLKYVASDGDLVENKMEESYETTKSSSHEDVLVDLKEESGSESCGGATTPCMMSGSASASEDGVPHLVEEAINDIVKPSKRRSGACTRKGDAAGKVEMFFFPDEENMSYSSSASQTFTDSQSSEDDIENEYCVLEQEIGIGYLQSKSNIPEVRLLTKDPIRVVDNHFTVPISKVDVLKAPKTYPKAVSKYTLREMTLVWHMYGGNDFAKPASSSNATTTTTTASSDVATNASSAKKQVTIISEKGSTQDLTSLEARRLSRNSSMDNINITYSTKAADLPAVNFIIPRSSPKPNLSGSVPNDSPTVLYDRQKSHSWQAQGGVNRQHDVLMELRLSKLKFQYEVYPKNTKHASRQVLLVQEVEIRDRMASSNINKFLYLHSSSARPKQSNANMVVIKATYIRPEPNIYHLQECCLRVSMLPLRLNIDQDSLLFLINFFTEISGNTKENDGPSTSNNVVAKPQMHPVMNIENINTTESSSMMVQVDERQVSAIPVSAKSPVFIRSFIFAPEVPIRLDYEGKRVDMSHGPLAGLIMGLGQLNCSELRLKRICNRHGILGIDKLMSYVLTEWLQDIKKNQLPSILGGVGPMYSLVQLFQGIRDLFWLPIEQYQKDGRIIRGLQRGANSFSTSTAMAALELTARIVYAIQRIAETAFDIVSPGPSIRHLRYYERSGGKTDHRKNRRHHKYNQPADIREGVATALLLVKEGFGETAQTLVRVASIEHEVKGAVGAVGGVLRQIPSTALTPIILASQATSNVLDGVKSQLVPDARAEAALKWRNDYF